MLCDNSILPESVNRVSPTYKNLHNLLYLVSPYNPTFHTLQKERQLPDACQKKTAFVLKAVRKKEEECPYESINLYTSAATIPPTIGATRNTQISLMWPAISAGPNDLAGLTDVPVNEMPSR